MDIGDITILNLNMLYLKYFDKVDREQHIPLGPLYLTQAIEDAGFTVDFRDYQMNTYEEPFFIDNCIEYLQDSAPIIGISVMANLLPFAILLGRELKHRYPQKTIILGGVGAKSVEKEILRRFPGSYPCHSGWYLGLSPRVASFSLIARLPSQIQSITVAS